MLSADRKLAGAGEVRPERLGTLGKEFFLRLEGALPAAAYEAAPLLWRIDDGPAARALGPARVLIEYWYHAAYSVGIGRGLGDHEGDWEGLAVAIDVRSGAAGELVHRPVAAYFAAHEGGAWHCAKELGWSGRPEAYSALGSHATYPAAGEYSTAFRKDVTARGRAWEAWRNLRPLPAEPYFGFAGAWGEPRWIGFMSGPRVPGPGFKPLIKETGRALDAALESLRGRCAVLAIP